ncbi:MAG: hypothetical protein JO205_00770 [Pseudolabrys sp.]|nr:hypothetical protein [Pseudolabrys sp.]
MLRGGLAAIVAIAGAVPTFVAQAQTATQQDKAAAKEATAEAKADKKQ